MSFFFFFFNSLAFSMIQWMLAIWSQVPLAILNPVWTPGSSWFTYFWSLKDFEHNFVSYSMKVMACMMAQMVQNPPAVQETQVLSLGWGDPLEKRLSTPVFLPGESHDQRSLVVYSPWGSQRVGHDWVATHSKHSG